MFNRNLYSIHSIPVLILVSMSVLAVGCRKDPKIDPVIPVVNTCDLIKYSGYTSTDFDYTKTNLNCPSPWGLEYVSKDSFTVTSPSANPNNPYEIVFTKWEESMGINAEIWKFNFCTGEKNKVASNIYYNLDWGSNGWLLFTGTGHQIFKVKDNGDSLTQLSSLPGYNHAGKWSPDGSKYYISGDNGLRIFDPNGTELSHPAVGYFIPYDWMNEEVLIGWRNNNLYALNVQSENLTQLTTTWTCSTCPAVYDQSHNDLYMYLTFGTGAGDDFYLKFDIDNQKVDTLAYLYDSYYYTLGTYITQTDKIITTLVRKDWKDYSMCEVWVRSNLLIMNPDCSDERIINIP